MDKISPNLAGLSVQMTAQKPIYKKAVLSQGGARDAAVNFDTYRILQRHHAVSLPLHDFLVCRLYDMCHRQGCKRDVEVRDRDETETFHFQFETRPRPRPYHFHEIETETETLIGRDRDIFRDLGTLSFISEVFLPCISVSVN